MHFSAVLLAGGKSSRMGRDKALLEIAGEPLWRRQIATLRGLHPDQLMLSGPPRGQGQLAIADEVENGGPLAGVAAALHRCTSPLLLVIAVDLPQMTTSFLRSLLSLCRGGKGVVPHAPDGFEPLAAVYPLPTAALADEQLRRGDLSMRSLVESLLDHNLIVSRPIAPNEMHLFKNLNHPADL